MSPYDADIILLALDRPAETEQAIASAFAQTGCSFHLTIVDQGSSPANIARLAALVQGRADATLLLPGCNLGVAGGRNLASAGGQGRIIVGLDNDAEFADPTVVARALAVLDAEPDLAAIGFRIEVFLTAANDLSSWGYPAALLAQEAGQFDTTTFVGAGHAIRRTAWNDAGGYDAALFFCWEEFDFSLRAIAAGWRIAYRGDIVVRHKVAPEARVAWSGERWFYFVRNRLYIARKWKFSWLALAPRGVGYLLKGSRHGLAWQSLRAVLAAAQLSRGKARQNLPEVARDYLRRNDAAYRGSLISRIRAELPARLPGFDHSRHSIPTTTGQSSR